MAEFSSMSGDDQKIPFNGSSTNEDALGLTNPDSVLTGTNRGQQALGSANIKTDSANQRIVVNDNTTNRVSFGRIGTGINDWGLKVSKPTFNVDTATADQLVFNSSQNVFKIAKTITNTFPNVTTGTTGAGTFGSNFATTAIAHGLSTVPAFIAFLSDGTSYYMLPYRNEFGSGAQFGFATLYVTSDATNVNFTTLFTAYGSGTQTYTSASALSAKVFLLQETAN